MRFSKNNSCENCPLKCDFYLTAKEMFLVHQLEPIHATYKKHEIICKQNSSASHAIILLDGSAKMYIDGVNNRNIILNILLPSNYIGLLSVYGSPVYTYNVAALNNCLCCQIDIELIKTLYYNNHNFLLKLNNAFLQSVTSIMSKLISLNQKQIRGKVAESLLYLSQLYDSDSFNLEITRKELGELSAVSEENAVRVITEFKNENIIELKSKFIQLKDIELLKRISVIG